MGRPRQTVTEYRSYELPQGFPITMRDGEEWRISPVKSSCLHYHNCFEIGLCQSGRGFISFGENEVPFAAGDVLCVGSNVPHTVWSAEGLYSQWCFLHLDPEALLENRVISGLMSNCHMILRPQEHPWAEALIREVQQEVHRQPAGYERCVQGLIQVFVVRLLRVSAPEPVPEISSSRQMSLAMALNYINAHYMESMTVEQLAAFCHMSPTHLRRLFRNQVGTTPLQFLSQVRILKSSAMLRNLSMRVSDIAAAVGYTSLSCYNRHFLELMGCTPTQWRSDPSAAAGGRQIRYTGWQRAETGEEIRAHNAAMSQGPAAGEEDGAAAGDTTESSGA